jgi:pimeloyl-ACP methyl ester carboxylesterase
VPALAEAGFRAIAVELPGHGLSDKPHEPESYSVEAMCDFVIGALDALSLPSAGLVGHSMGASVVVHVAGRAPDRVTGVAIIAPVGFDGVPGMPLFRALTPGFAIPLLPYMATRLVVWAMIAVACRLRRPNSKELEEFYAPTQFPDFTRALAHMLHRFDWKAPFPRLAVPRLVMVATKDHLSPWRNAHRYAGDTEPVVLQGAGHMILDELPGQVNAALIDFFRAPSKSGYISRKYG